MIVSRKEGHTIEQKWMAGTGRRALDVQSPLVLGATGWDSSSSFKGRDPRLHFSPSFPLSSAALRPATGLAESQFPFLCHGDKRIQLAS